VGYSLLARCPQTGHFGLAVASYCVTAGALTDGLCANIVALSSQGYAKPGNNALGLRLLFQGFTSEAVLAALIENDPDHAYRQIVVIDRKGTIAAGNGTRLRAWSGHVLGDGCVVFGDMLAGPEVLDAMRSAFDTLSSARFEDRLLRALEAGRDAGGLRGRDNRLAERSAGVVVCGDFDYYDWDLRVDAQPHALAELRRVHDEYQPHAAYYIERARNPHNATPAMEFADMLQRGRAAGNGG